MGLFDFHHHVLQFTYLQFTVTKNLLFPIQKHSDKRILFSTIIHYLIPKHLYMFLILSFGNTCISVKIYHHQDTYMKVHCERGCGTRI